MKSKRFIMLIMLFVFTLFIPLNVKASQKNNISLKTNVTYKNYDVTSDGKADSFKVQFKPRKYLRFYVNGKKVYSASAKDIFKIDIELSTLKNKKNFIHLKKIFYYDDLVQSDIFLTYSKGKFIKSTDVRSHMNGYDSLRNESFVQKVGADYIRVREQAFLYGVGIVQYYIDYKCSGSKLIPTSNTYNLTYKHPNPYFSNVKNIWTVKNTLHMQSEETADFFRVPCNDQCKIYKLRYSKDGESAMRFCKLISSSGKLYMPSLLYCPNSYCEAYFKESIYV